jgi:hypothetical protein
MLIDELLGLAGTWEGDGISRVPGGIIPQGGLWFVASRPGETWLLVCSLALVNGLDILFGRDV